MSESVHSGLSLEEHTEALSPTKIAFNSGSMFFMVLKKVRDKDARLLEGI